MVSIVIPVKNESQNIKRTLDNCQNLHFKKIIVVLNGCKDNSKEIILSHALKKYIHLIEFPEALGVDIPRAIGAAYVYKHDPSSVLFLDGDMQGDINQHLGDLVTAVADHKLDMALTNCYPYITTRSSIANEVLYHRERLNRYLGVFAQLGLANPSHGPHTISQNLLENLPLYALAIPPLSLAMAIQANFKVQVATSVPHNLLLSPLRDEEHCVLIAETIIGDCLEALCYLKGEHPLRENNGIYYSGYHTHRRFDILEEYLKTLNVNDQNNSKSFSPRYPVV